MRVSVIIPTWNEESHIAQLLERTRAVGAHEVIVVDGGSTDRTWEEAERADQRIRAPQGRANQMNAGAAASTGDVLLFLHADCWLAQDCLDALAEAVQHPRFAAGCFRQSIDSNRWRYRLVEWGNTLRVRISGWAYGDQGIFCHRATFVKLGGFPPLRFMEDLYFMKRIKPMGRCIIANAAIHTSARRWERRGIIRQTIRNWTLITLAHCGLSPDRLAKFYPHVR